MTYLNAYHKEKTERCCQKMQSWFKSPMTSDELYSVVETMKQKHNAALAM